MKYKVKYKTMMDYWHSRNFKSMIVNADSETSAEMICSSIIEDGSSLLSKQIYEMEVKEFVR